jgi:hypothetical protein
MRKLLIAAALARLASVVALTLTFLVCLVASTIRPAYAVPVYGLTYAPNWALGSPQPVGIGICSDGNVANRCISGLGLGGESDTLNIRLLARPTTQAALNELGSQFFAGRLAAANENLQQWWYITIPNAVWLGVGSGWVYYFNDGSAPAGFATDAIAYCNCNGLADILWASTFDPPDVSMLPIDFVSMVSGFQSFDETGMGSGPWTEANAPPPSDEECTGNFAASICNQTLMGDQIPDVPEPSTWVMMLSGLAALGLVLRNWRRNVQDALSTSPRLWATRARL